MLFIIAQIIGVIVLVITVIGIQFKTKEKILFFQIIANSLVSIQYFLLNALTGGIIAFINVIRCIIFYYYKKKDKKPSLTFLIIFIICAIICGIVTWQNGYSIMPIIASVVFTYGLWQDDVKITRICIAITEANWTIYNIIVQAYAGALQAGADCISALIALVRYKQKNIKQTKTE